MEAPKLELEVYGCVDEAFQGEAQPLVDWQDVSCSQSNQ